MTQDKAEGMTPEEAIDNLEIQVRVQQTIDNPCRANTLKLGIEVLKVYKKSLVSARMLAGYKLPGETTASGAGK